MSDVYRYRKGRSGPAGLSAAQVANELNRIRAAHGDLTPPIIVSASRDRHALFHHHFDWNNKVAADKWRNHQARNLINVVEIIPEQTGKAVPAFVNVTIEPANVDDAQPGRATHAYRPIAEVIEDPAQKARFLEMIARRLKALRDQYDHVTEFAAVWAAVDEVVSGIAS